ncbi:MAG: hypothetical protein HY703_10620 [Gemmatimonadetes bacterium]|nr:hypothetical protein [Gemmatimonadota bacterium]
MKVRLQKNTRQTLFDVVDVRPLQPYRIHLRLAELEESIDQRPVEAELGGQAPALL